MELTAWQKICHRLLGRAFKKKARNDQKLSDDLVKGNMPIMPEVYLAQVFVTTFAVSIICIMLLTAVFLPDIGLISWYESRPDDSFALACYEWEYWNGDLVDETLESRGCPFFAYMEFPFFAKILIPAILGFIVPFGTYKYLKGSASRAANLRGVALEKYLPYAASYTAAMAAANATPHKIFKSLALNGDIYGEIAYDSSMIYRDVTLLGYDLLTAMKMGVDRAASPWMTEFFQGMVGTLTAGGSLKLYFLNRAEHYMRENRTRLHEFLESLAMLAESYVVVAVAMPLFLIVMLVIMFWVSGAGAQMEESTLYMVVLLVLPMLHGMFAFIVWSSSEEQKM
ncbi:MAG: type II secretion system F family protein [Candidatus Poseidoniaceae archaeon]|nr:hypothetical protein [Euryarchaeota archaeon]MCH1527927.1 type II secretion system F family protein [Candidatus Poseidoniaceae archaeon]|tara:strand:+ start:3175 stop:4194 length:1020 start_codon:yes stop_codon:yes gene_type:complete